MYLKTISSIVSFYFQLILCTKIDFEMYSTSLTMFIINQIISFTVITIAIDKNQMHHWIPFESNFYSDRTLWTIKYLWLFLLENKRVRSLWTFCIVVKISLFGPFSFKPIQKMTGLRSCHHILDMYSTIIFQYMYKISNHLVHLPWRNENWKF